MQNAKCKIKELNVKKSIPLALHTTFRIGGPAKYFYQAKSDDDIIESVKMARQLNIPYFILGEGSNILVSDKGFEGLVIKMQNSELKVKNSKITADAGVKLSKLVDLASKNSLSGLEWAAGIPGTVGGAIRGNAGAFGSSMSEIVETIKILGNGNTKLLGRKEAKFDYRDSIFKHNKDVILSVELQLKKANLKEIKERVEKNLNHRKKTQPIEKFSAGCIFKNTRNKLNKAAAELIEKAGLKGKGVGRAMVSEKHANFIINAGKAKAEDVIILIDLIKARIGSKFDVQLQEEIEYVGF